MAQDELVVDIATRLVAPDEDVYIVRPGDGYWLYDTFATSTYVFLDFPALNLSFEGNPPSDRQLRLLITMSLAVRDWLDNDKLGPEPSHDAADYVGKDYRRRLGRYVGAVKRLYYQLKPGTIVVVPPKNWFEDVLIGELVGPPQMLRPRGLYSGEAVPARRVVWHRRKPKSQFPSDVRRLLERPDPVMQLDRSLRGEILRAGFDQYGYEGEFAARLNTKTDEFSTLDDYNIQYFVNYVTGVLVAYEQGRKAEVDFTDAIKLLRASPGLALDLKLNINSEGFQRLVDTTVRPLVVAALLSLALHGDGASAAHSNVVIKNSANVSADPCTIEVNERVLGALKLMKLEEWKRVCESARDAKGSTGLSTTMGVERGKEKKP